MSDAEVLERPLGLCPPELGTRHINFAEAVGFFAHVYYRHIADCAHYFVLSVVAIETLPSGFGFSDGECFIADCSFVSRGSPLVANRERWLYRFGLSLFASYSDNVDVFEFSGIPRNYRIQPRFFSRS